MSKVCLEVPSADSGSRSLGNVTITTLIIFAGLDGDACGLNNIDHASVRKCLNHIQQDHRKI
jgi:hypothetical protein